MMKGVQITPLKRIVDQRGMVMRMMRKSDDTFVGFGEIYFSIVNYGVVKGWKRHREMVLNLAVPIGSVKFVLYDSRDTSSTKGKILEIELGEDNYSLLTIPPMVWVAFQGLSNPFGMVANCASIIHDPDEAEGLPIDTENIPFIWQLGERL
ncbi:dTDP-4-dehydrorhamnose 3,5-epimerase [Desulfuribacillus stibiiarsenatis]|uniref:dTDP-4-dehydrorhamnose 3,5-epimerase n=1 Tax=Desulfuribacillus stibiiarsenatis TaxID=1390249 RepID=A0A1E5L651_9FIRM|nr:dTDP-4-dehydrorhamnose 3,5-epimerase family protein [Desulfuribacillus stibiiarsenatis]OEH85508.1 dTDP-4-dehydrorhamnose 3,5-epimerase [Desulfuribacillus stibiiarsenatis]